MPRVLLTLQKLNLRFGCGRAFTQVSYLSIGPENHQKPRPIRRLRFLDVKRTFVSKVHRRLRKLIRYNINGDSQNLRETSLLH